MPIDFSFSVGAQNVQSAFYGKKALVYVEGRDDLNFWCCFFPNNEYELIDVGGIENIKKKIYDIKNKGLKCIVACDADYRRFDENQTLHPLVVQTYSHSIECVMYCPLNIDSLVKKLARCLDNKLKDITDVYGQFESGIKRLIAYDIANSIYEKGVAITDVSCNRFLENNESTLISQEKVDFFLSTIDKNFEDVDIDLILKKMDEDPRNIRQIAKGHFQTMFVTNLIKKSVFDTCGKVPKISNDTLYSSLVSCISTCKTSCPEKNYVYGEISNALKYLGIE